LAILAIDTSSDLSYLAIAAGDKIFSRSSASQGSHAEQLVDLFEKLLADAMLLPKDITQLIYGAGPGSFTGLRIGLSFIKGLAAGLKIPVEAHSSLAAAAWTFSNQASCIYAIADARRQELFCEKYKVVHGRLQAETNWTEAKIITSAELIEMAQGEQALVCSIDEVISLHDNYHKNTANLADNLLKIASRNSVLQASMTQKQETAQSFLIGDLANLTPNYVRLPAAKKISER
jgi:tRNA threonylcarbamoyladenosine biosynthesis protein TsaB